MKLQPFNSWKLPHHYNTMEIDITTNNKTWPGQYRDLPKTYPLGTRSLSCAHSTILFTQHPPFYLVDVLLNRVRMCHRSAHFIYIGHNLSPFCSTKQYRVRGYAFALLTSFILDIICHLSAQPSSTEFGSHLHPVCSIAIIVLIKLTVIGSTGRQSTQIGNGFNHPVVLCSTSNGPYSTCWQLSAHCQHAIDSVFNPYCTHCT